jgi:hypothetical protein
MNRLGAVAVLLVLTVIISSCGGSGGAEEVIDGGSNLLRASFAPFEPDPGSNTVSFDQGSARSNVVEVVVRVTGTNDVYSASFDVLYDPAFADFTGWSPGSVLEDGGHNPLYVISEPTAGRVVVGASRQGGESSVDVTDTRTLVELSFRVAETGTSEVQIANEDLKNESGQVIQDIGWHGGNLRGD